MVGRITPGKRRCRHLAEKSASRTSEVPELTITQDQARVMTRLKAVYRSWAITCAGKQVYGQRFSHYIHIRT
jgi:hypothetical protein